jgi:hypothetical protein
MNDRYQDFTREPSMPHQCQHFSEQTGIRCRATAMHNNYMCYHHRTNDIQPVIENDPFLIDSLDTRDDVQRHLLALAARLACNHIDLQRAAQLHGVLRSALRNLNAAPNHTLHSTPPPIALEDGPPDPERLRAFQLAHGDLPEEDDEENQPPLACQPQTDNAERSTDNPLAPAYPEPRPPDPALIAPRIPVPPSCFAPPERQKQYDDERNAYDAAVIAYAAARRAQRNANRSSHLPPGS